jgi:hypothetical protein
MANREWAVREITYVLAASHWQCFDILCVAMVFGVCNCNHLVYKSATCALFVRATSAFSLGRGRHIWQRHEGLTQCLQGAKQVLPSSYRSAAEAYAETVFVLGHAYIAEQALGPALPWLWTQAAPLASPAAAEEAAVSHSTRGQKGWPSSTSSAYAYPGPHPRPGSLMQQDQRLVQVLEAVVSHAAQQQRGQRAALVLAHHHSVGLQKQPGQAAR